MNMNKLLVTTLAAIFASFAGASFAANGTMKLEDLSKEQRMDMRSRADQLTADRAAGRQTKAADQSTTVKKPRTAKAKAASSL